MERVFLRVLDLSLSAAAVIAVVILIRLVLRGAPKKWRYVLWSAAGFRLACPVSFRAAFSIFRLGPKSTVASAASAGTAQLRYIPRTAVAAAPVIPNPVTVTGAPIQIPANAVSAETAASALPTVSSAGPMQILLLVGTVLWLAGMAVMLALGVSRYLRMKDRLSDAVRLEDGVFASDSIRVPFILGLVPPRVFVPADLGGKELDYVLAHEKVHLRRLDHWVKLFSYLLLSLHWFNPLVWLSFYLLGRDMEMSCDERVLASFGGEAKAYSRTLLAFAVGRRFPAPAPLGFGESDVSSRIRNVLRWRKPKLYVTVLAVALCLAAVAACTADPKEKPEETPAPTAADTPWAWSSTLQVSDVREAVLLNAADRQAYVWNSAQCSDLVRMLNAVSPDQIVRGRGIPSEKLLELRDTGYALRFAGGVIELDIPDAGAEAVPGVWEIHNDALYEWLEAQWKEASLSWAEEADPPPTPAFEIPDVPANTENDTVYFDLREGNLVLLGLEGKTNQDVMDRVPFDDISFRGEDNFLAPGDPSILSGGALRPGLNIPETRLALFGYTYHSNIGEQQMRKPQITLHTEEEGFDYPVTGIYAEQFFDLTLDYSNYDGGVLSHVTLTFLPNGDEDHAAELFAMLRAALTEQLGAPQAEEMNSHYDRENYAYDQNGQLTGNGSEPLDCVLSGWRDDTATLTLRLEIGQYGFRSLCIDFYKNSYYVDEPEASEEGLRKMADLTAEDITGIFSSGWIQPEADALAPLMNAAAAQPIALSKDQTPKENAWWQVEVYLSGGPDGWSSQDEHYELCALQTDGLIFVRYWDGQHEYGGAEEFWLEDAALYNLIRGYFRSDGVIESDAWEKYGAYLEARAQETVDTYAPYGAGRFIGFDIIRLEKTDHIWRTDDGEALPVYAWNVAFYPEDVNHVGWVGGMKLDADERVVGFEQHTYFAVRETDGRSELIFLGWDEFLGEEES